MNKPNQAMVVLMVFLKLD